MMLGGTLKESDIRALFRTRQKMKRYLQTSDLSESNCAT
jgi:hypothetical protein